MFGDVSMELWINGHQRKALQRHLKERGTDIETVMQEKLMEIYCQTVPDDERLTISDTIEQEQAAHEESYQASRRFALIHVTEQGKSEYYLRNHGYELPYTAKAMRGYLRGEYSPRITSFSAFFGSENRISAEAYEEYLAERMENTGRVTNAYDIDFDEDEFSTHDIAAGWQTYSISDVVKAAYHAWRNQNIPTDRRLAILQEKLAGKEIATPEHLVNSEVSFGDESAEMDNEIGMELSL